MASVMSTLVKIHTQYIGNKLIREIYAQQLVMYWVSYTNYIREENTNKYDKRGKVLAKDPKRHNQKNINLIAIENLDNL